jgi:hypothetical protein
MDDEERTWEKIQAWILLPCELGSCELGCGLWSWEHEGEGEARPKGHMPWGSGPWLVFGYILLTANA